MKKRVPFLKQLSIYVPGLCFVIITLSSCSGDSNNQAEQEQQTAQQTAPAPQPEEQPAEVQEPDTAQMAQTEEPQPASTPSQQAPSAPPMEKPMYKAQDVSYKELDANSNGILSRTEFYSGFYKAWDENGNNVIEENEFTASADKFFNKNNYNNYGSFSDWDTDANSEVSMEEFRKGMNNVTGDKTNAERLVTAWDLDNDDKVERVELDNITVMLDQDSN